jgi:hypothetical protein
VTHPHNNPDLSHLTPAHQMRLRLALARLNEQRALEPSRSSQATLILLNERLGNALEDMIELALETSAE